MKDAIIARMKWISKLCLLMVLVIGPMAATETVAEESNLWRVEMPVENQTVKVRNRIMIQAFDRLMMRLTGDDRETVISNFSRVRRQASQWVTQFSYHPEIDITKDPPEERQILSLVFDEVAIQHMIVEKGLQPWLGKRPETVVIFDFLGLEELGMAGDTHFLEEQRRQWVQNLQDMANVMAWPIRFVSAEALLEHAFGEEQPFDWSRADAQLEEKQPSLENADRVPEWIHQWMKSFDTSSLLLGQLIIDRQGQWLARWEHYLPHAARVLAIDGSAEMIVSALEDFVGRNIRTEFFENRERFEAQKVRLKLQGNLTLNILKEMEELLQDMESVDTFRLEKLEGDAAVFELITHDGLKTLELNLDKIVRLKKVVHPVTVNDQENADNASVGTTETLQYRWK